MEKERIEGKWGRREREKEGGKGKREKRRKGKERKKEKREREKEGRNEGKSKEKQLLKRSAVFGAPIVVRKASWKETSSYTRKHSRV